MDRPARLEADDVAGEHHLRAEAPGLGDGAVREVGAGEALREAEVVLDRRALAGLPAGRFALDDDGLQALPTRRRPPPRARPGPPPTMHRSYSGCSALVRRPSASARSSVDGAAQRLRRRGPARAGGRRRSASRGVVQPQRFVVAFEIEPAVRHVVAGEERLDLVAALRPAVADDPHDGVRGRGAPSRQSLSRSSSDRVQPLLGRVPRLQQVVVEADVVDRLDRDVGVGVRGEQHELGVGRVHARLLEELDAGHLRHALVGERSARPGGRAGRTRPAP